VPRFSRRRYRANPAAISDAEIRRLGQAYIEGQDQSGTRQIQDMAKAYADKVQREFRALTKKVDVVFVERDPYTSLGELVQDVETNRRMYIYGGHSEGLLWSPEVNLMARAVHDWDHVQQRAAFTPAEEIRAFQTYYDRAPALEPLLMSEIALQAASTSILGGFSDKQKIVIPSPEMQRIARTRLNPRRRVSPAARLVWDLSGALEYMAPADAMRLLAARGVPFQDALIAVTAAKQVR
jgi:hypothetical protein